MSLLPAFQEPGHGQEEMTMEEVSAEGRTLKEAIDVACTMLGVGRSELQYKLDVTHFRDSFGKARGVDTVRILAWREAGRSVVAQVAAPARDEERPERPERSERPERAARPERAPERSERSERPERSERAPDRAPRVRSEERSDRRPEGRSDRDGGRSERSESPRELSTPTGDEDQQVLDFLKRTYDLMGWDVDVTVRRADDRLAALVVVKNDASDEERQRVHEATSQLANRLGFLEGVRMSVTVEESDGAREEREAQLRAVAQRVVDKVIAEKRAVTLKAMNSYERRIVHMVVAENEGVTSRSIGDGQNKRVQILPARGKGRDEDEGSDEE